MSEALIAEAKEKDWTVVSMKNDWKKIFAFEKNEEPKNFTGGNGANGDGKKDSVSFGWVADVKKSAPVQTSMHPLFEKASRVTKRIIGVAIEVHRDKGPGLIEPIYEWCLTKELELRGLACLSQKVVVVTYKGFAREEPLRFDMLVDGCVLVEAKAVAKILPIHEAQLLSYMKLLDIPIGLLINFHEMKLTDGVHRLILPGANR